MSILVLTIAAIGTTVPCIVVWASDVRAPRG
jgi:hypothetical protein